MGGAYGKQNADGHWCLIFLKKEGLMSTDGNCGPKHDDKVCPHDYCRYNGRCGPITDHPAVFDKFSNGHCETPAGAAKPKAKKARGRPYKFKCRMSKNGKCGPRHGHRTCEHNYCGYNGRCGPIEDHPAFFKRFSNGVCKTWRRNKKRGALLQKTRFMMNELAQIGNMLEQEADA